jgi:hypothetical protein
LSAKPSALIGSVLALALFIYMFALERRVAADAQVAWTDAVTPKPAWATSALQFSDLRGLLRLARESGWHILLTIGLAHYDPRAAAREAAADTAPLGRRDLLRRRPGRLTKTTPKTGLAAAVNESLRRQQNDTDEGHRDAELLGSADALAKHSVGEQYGYDRVERSEHGHDRQLSMEGRVRIRCDAA